MMYVWNSICGFLLHFGVFQTPYPWSINWWWFIVYDQSKQSSLHLKTLPTFMIEWLCCLFFPTICFSKLKLWGFPHSGSVFARLERYQFEFQLFNIFSLVVWVGWQQPTLSRSYLQICFLVSSSFLLLRDLLETRKVWFNQISYSFLDI